MDFDFGDIDIIGNDNSIRIADDNFDDIDWDSILGVGQVDEQQSDIHVLDEFGVESDQDIKQDTNIPNILQTQNRVQDEEKDPIGVLPKYQMRRLGRGEYEDTYFEDPLYPHMTSNQNLISIVSYGAPEAVLQLSNLSNQTPRTKPKCDQALENKLFVDATFALSNMYGLVNLADVYRRLAFLSDRVCLGCPKLSHKTACLCGRFRCHHCVHNGRDIDFSSGFHQWLMAGCPSRHTVVITN